jgi:hypothetical protein
MVSVVVQKLSTAFNGVAREFTTPGSPSVWQFRGIKYGNIPARFMQATLNESFPNVLDTTNYGCLFQIHTFFSKANHSTDPSAHSLPSLLA